MVARGATDASAYIGVLVHAVVAYALPGHIPLPTLSTCDVLTSKILALPCPARPSRAVPCRALFRSPQSRAAMLTHGLTTALSDDDCLRDDFTR